MTEIRALLFDKDGTLFNFQATWGAFTSALVLQLALGDTARARDLGLVVGFDTESWQFAADSPVYAATNAEIAGVLLPHLPELSLAGLIARMNELGAVTPQAEAVPLLPLLAELRSRGLQLGLATNDGEAPARANLASAGVLEHFEFVAGYDSGHGGKPAPGMLLAFAAALSLDPAEVAMVGDSRHDMIAGRAAGMQTVAVLTGLAGVDDLAPIATVVLPDIGHLPAWLDARKLAVAGS